MTLLKHEMKMNIKVLLIWTLSVGVLCAGCILLFKSLEEGMRDMADAYSNMGAFSAALGMDKLSISTLEGFYGTEIALMFAIGGAMFAAMTGAAMLSKEEEGHTCEFLLTLPVGRGTVILGKYAAMALLVLLFNVLTVLMILAGFAGMGEMLEVKAFALYHGMQFLMQLEIGSVCFLISAMSKRKQLGASLGLAMVLYMADLMCRIIPDLEKLKYVTPYYFSNGADIFADGKVEVGMVVICLGVTLFSAVAAAAVYKKRDLAA